MAQLSIFRFYYIWSMLSREEHFNSNQEEYKEAFLLRVLDTSGKELHAAYEKYPNIFSNLYIVIISQNSPMQQCFFGS